MNNLWRGIVCIKYRGALKRHARASGAQRAITLRSRNARKCARGSIRLVREVSWNTKLCARYEIRRSDTKIQFFFFSFTSPDFQETSCLHVATINNSKLFHLKEHVSWRLFMDIERVKIRHFPSFGV